MPENELHIRDALVEELDEVSKLLKVAYQQYKTSIPKPIWKAYLEDIMDVRSRLPVSQLIVAEVDKRLVGTVTLFLGESPDAEQVWPEGWAGIRLLAVHPAYRGKGVGRALMEECIRRCRRRGITTVGLHTTKLMEIARRMYERMGFKRVPKGDFHPRPSVVVMAYRLDL